MKKYIILLIFILLVSSVYGACFDDDNGLNYKQRGFCKDTEDTEGSDFCNRDGLVEYYCHQSLCKAQLKICEDCKEGICLSKEADDIIEVNRPPKVDLFVLTTPGKTEAAFKAVVSDSDGEMVVYTIEFGDGNKASNQANVLHDYQQEGNYSVTITARDVSGAVTTLTKDITITKEAEIIEKDYQVIEGEPKESKGFFTKIKDFFKRLFGKE